MPKNQTKPTTTVALNRLTAWKGNVRKTGAKDGLDELAASIAAHGLLQSLVVRDAGGGKFAVIAGRRRLLAMKALAKDGKLSADFPVPVRLIAGDQDAAEISLAENIVRVPMHPADQFEAFRVIIDGGASIADVAGRFGVSEDLVEKRLKLGRLSPVILAAYREGDLGLEQAQAFALSDDHAAQETVYNGLPAYHSSPGHIRRALTQGEVSATDKRVRCIGLDAYRETGGIVRRDLFAGDGDGIYLQDAALLDKLVREKLETAATGIRAEGWSWVEIAPDLDYADTAKFRNVHPERVPLADHDAVELDRLTGEYDRLSDQLDADQDNADLAEQVEQLVDRMDELQATGEIWPAETLAVAGAIVTIDHDGGIEVRRGLIRPEDARKAKTLAKAAESPSGGSPSADGNGHSATLVSDLTAHRSAAISAALCEQPDIALAAVVHALALDLLYPQSRGGSCLQVAAKSPELERFLAAPAACKGLAALQAARNRLGDRLPGDPADFWQWCLAQSRDTLLDLLALCAALMVDAVICKGDASGLRIAHANALAQAVTLDMTACYAPTADGYFSRVSRDQIIAAFREAKGCEPAPAWLKLKKAELAKRVAKALAKTGWLPEPLRRTMNDTVQVSVPLPEAAE